MSESNSGDDSPTGTFPADDLDYTYFTDSNRLKRVSDSTNSNFGFDDGNTNPALDDYEYDLNGNMTLDRNKGITTIVYNHLNLPIEIQWSSTKKIEYLYNAAGGKVQKKVTNGANIKTTDYLDGFQYNQQLLEFFPHSEGYVKATTLSLGNNPNYAFNYVYNYTDHLGNVRLSYAKDPQTGNLKILDESHYYPFGLKHQEYQASSFTTNPIQGIIIAPVANNPYKYKYNGKEFQDELNLNLYDYGARNYDSAIGRWNVIDPMAPKYFSHSPYAYALNNPVYFIDPDGMEVSNGQEEDNDEEVYYGVVGLGVASVSGSVGKYSLDFLLSYRYTSFTSFVFGADGEKSIHGAYNYVLAPENIADYIKMTNAKREGELGVAILFSVPYAVVAAPAVVAYGSVPLESYWASFVIKASVDISTQVVFAKGNMPTKEGVASAIVGALVPNEFWFFSGFAAEGAGLGTKAFFGELIEKQDWQKAGIKSFMAIPGAGNAMESVTENAISGAVMNSVLINATDKMIENETKF
ncbi:MAG: RHS repeat-associated core domain-containing protein [Flavobacteriia bacterium]|nr:RHS repeat-associated core domain-containing protein [Flavobacteriia bacterium]